MLPPLKKLLWVIPVALAASMPLGAQGIDPVNANWQTAICFGNLETSDKKISTPGIQYKVAYRINGDTALVSIAGRTFQAKVDYGKGTWIGPWLKEIDKKSSYFSFLPLNGGEIKLEFSPNQWFSGNC